MLNYQTALTHFVSVLMQHLQIVMFNIINFLYIWAKIAHLRYDVMVCIGIAGEHTNGNVQLISTR